MNRGALPRHSVRSSSTPPVPPAPLPVLHSAKSTFPPTSGGSPTINYPTNSPHPHPQYYPPPHHTNFLPSYPYNAPVAASPSPPPSLLQPQLQESLHFASQKPQTFHHQTPSSQHNYAPAQHGTFTPSPAFTHSTYTPHSPTRSLYNSTPASSSPPMSRSVYTPPPPLILDSVFNSEKAFEEVKKTIANTLKNASSPTPTHSSPSLPLPAKQLHKPPQDDASAPLTTMQLSSSLLTSSSLSTTSIAEAAQQVKTVKALVSNFTSQLKSAASSKNTSEFIDLLSKFSTEYSSVMKNEDAALNNGLSVVLPTTPFGAVHIKHEDYATPDVLPKVVDSPAVLPKGENVQMIKEMQELAAALKTKVKAKTADMDQKIQQISEDILAVLKAQYVIDMQSSAEHATQRLQQVQDRHLAELRNTSERYERKIQEMAEQYENTNQMLRERMLVGSGAGDDVKRENAQLRAQVSTLQLELKGYEERLRSADEYRREQRRKDLMLGGGAHLHANEELAALNRNEQIQDLMKELQEKNRLIEDLQALYKEKESLASTQDAQAKAAAKKEQEFTQKLAEMENMNKALRSSIQQMQERAKKS